MTWNRSSSLSNSNDWVWGKLTEPIFLYLVTINSKEKTLYIHRNWCSENHTELDFMETEVQKHELTYEEKSGFDLAFKKALPLWEYRQKIERQGQGKTL